MSNENFAQKAGDFAVDTAADTAVDSVINQGIDIVVTKIHIPGGELADQMLKTGIDQAVNTEINNEINKGAGGLMSDVEGLFGRKNEG